MKRTEWLQSKGYKVLRYWNHQIFEDWDVIETDLFAVLEAEVCAE